MLYDITTEARGGSYRYYIRKDNLESLTTEQNIDQAFLEAVPVSEDERFISEVYLKYRNKELDAHGDPAIMTKERRNTAYVGVLANVFPYVERFRTNQDIQQKYVSQDSSLDVAKNRRICSGRYFDLYFSHTSNAHMLTTKLAEDAMTLIDSESDLTLIQNHFTELLLVTIPPYQHKGLFEYLELLIDRLDGESSYRLFMILFEVIYLIDDHLGSL